MRVMDAKAVLDTMPQEKSILCQVVDQSGNAFNYDFEFHNVEPSWMVQLRVHHKELVDLYDIRREGMPAQAAKFNELADLVMTAMMGETLSTSYGQRGDSYNWEFQSTRYRISVTFYSGTFSCIGVGDDRKDSNIFRTTTPKDVFTFVLRYLKGVV